MKNARIAGVLMLLGMITGVLSIVPDVESGGFLADVYPNRSQVLTGAVFQFLLVPLYIGFALALYPVLRNYSKALSIGFVGFRMMAGVFQIIGIILLPMFIILSRKYLEQNGSALIPYETVGEMLHLSRDLTNHLGVMLATGLGNILLYYLFFQAKLIPLWLSLWGGMGNILLILASFLLLFQLIEVISPAYGMMTIPLVLQEIVLAIWLIVKGLNRPLKTQSL